MLNFSIYKQFLLHSYHLSLPPLSPHFVSIHFYNTLKEELLVFLRQFLHSLKLKYTPQTWILLPQNQCPIFPIPSYISTTFVPPTPTPLSPHFISLYFYNPSKEEFPILPHPFLHSPKPVYTQKILNPTSLEKMTQIPFPSYVSTTFLPPTPIPYLSHPLPL